jgi:hypothetical protein
MSAYEYRTCKDKNESDLEVMAEQALGRGMEKGNQKERSCDRGPSQVHKNKEASKNQPHPPEEHGTSGTKVLQQYPSRNPTR